LRLAAWRLALAAWLALLPGLRTADRVLASTNAAARTLRVDPRPVLRPEAEYAIRLFRHGHFLPPGTEIPDGFTDGGRGMDIYPDGRLTSSRELIQVDRAQDEFLRGYIEHVRGKEFMDLAPAARAVRIGMYIERLMTAKCAGNRGANDAWRKLVWHYNNRGVLLGEIAGIHGAGVCRHRTPLFKLLANAAGLKVSMVRGCYRHRSGRIGKHAWNELYLDDGSVFVVDIMSPPRGWRFPNIREAYAQKYLSIDQKPLYVDGRVPWPPAIEHAPPRPGTRTPRVTLVPPMPDGVLYYTLDGTEPTAKSKRYKAPFAAPVAGTVRAVAIYPDGRASGVAERKITEPRANNESRKEAA
jgi:hypothetical protein